jgi:hypothetical protein
MPRIERFFANQKVSDWTSGGFGGGGGGFSAVGGDTSTYTDPGGTQWVSHAFSATGSFTVFEGAIDAEILVVAGGASGVAIGGGGGGGGFRELTGQPVSATGGPGGNGVYPIVVGAGGAERPTPPSGVPRVNGNPSSGLGFTSTGGGEGGQYNYPQRYGQPGGSGGGMGGTPSGYGSAGSGNSPPVSPPQGNPGGSSQVVIYGMEQGGGGGAGEAGKNGGPWTGATPSSPLGSGGDGAPNVYRYGPGTPVTYAGGGGGYAANGANAVNGPGVAYWPRGGAGGGGWGSSGVPDVHPEYNPSAPNPVAAWPGRHGVANTGGGAGSNVVGSGGSGIVIVRYPIS